MPLTFCKILGKNCNLDIHNCEELHKVSFIHTLLLHGNVSYFSAKDVVHFSN